MNRVKGFDDRMDLYSACIEGPKNTPYEDGLFFFDFQLGPDYPSVPPTCHYISYCCDRLNPNLYEDGKVVRFIDVLTLSAIKGSSIRLKAFNG